MKLEHRYDVIKLKTGKPVDCLVIEKDWPEYEPTLKMLADRVDGVSQSNVSKAYMVEGNLEDLLFWDKASAEIASDMNCGTVKALCVCDDRVSSAALDLNGLANKHAEWLMSMGWWKDKTPLEALMLVVSECGEAANEVRSNSPTDNFKTELADIVLRVLGIAAEHNIDIQQAVVDKMSKNLKLTPNPNRVK